MKARALGHIVVRVRNLKRSEEFYHGLLGLPIAAHDPELPMTFFTLGNHHDFAILETGSEDPEGPPVMKNFTMTSGVKVPVEEGSGIFHVAFRVGDTIEELRAVKAELEAAGATIYNTMDHTVTKSLYVLDPDGHGIELYVDASDVWKSDPIRVTDAMPLEI